MNLFLLEFSFNFNFGAYSKTIQFTGVANGETFNFYIVSPCSALLVAVDKDVPRIHSWGTVFEIGSISINSLL